MPISEGTCPHAGAATGAKSLFLCGLPAFLLSSLYLPKPHKWTPSLEPLGSTCHVYILYHEMTDFCFLCLCCSQPCDLGEAAQPNPALCHPCGKSVRKDFIIWRVKEEMEFCPKWGMFQGPFPKMTIDMWEENQECFLSDFREFVEFIGLRFRVPMRVCLCEYECPGEEIQCQGAQKEDSSWEVKGLPPGRTLCNFMGWPNARDHFNSGRGQPEPRDWLARMLE